MEAILAAAEVEQKREAEAEAHEDAPPAKRAALSPEASKPEAAPVEVAAPPAAVEVKPVAVAAAPVYAAPVYAAPVYAAPVAAPVFQAPKVEAAPPPANNERIEVLWDLHDDETGAQHVWWGCRVSNLDGRKALLIYDKAHGFDAEQLDVVFGAEHALLDVGSQETLPWRREGESFVAEAVIPTGAAPVTMADLVANQNDADQRATLQGGDPLQAASQAAMNGLPHMQQMEIAQQYRDFSEHMRMHLVTLLEKNGAGYTVTQEDTQEIMDAFRRN